MSQLTEFVPFVHIPHHPTARKRFTLQKRNAATREDINATLHEIDQLHKRIGHLFDYLRQGDQETEVYLQEQDKRHKSNDERLTAIEQQLQSLAAASKPKRATTRKKTTTVPSSRRRTKQ